MKLNLKRPIVFFDLETTGTNVIRDRIVEISIIKIHPDGREEIFTQRVNPEMPIPAESTAIHGITDEDVVGAPKFKELARTIAKMLEGTDIGGFNSIKFDIPLLAEEFDRTDVSVDLHRYKFIDVQNIFHKMEKRTLSAAYQFYCGKNLENAHTAEADTRATYEVLMAQLDRYPDLENDMDKLAEFSKMNDNVDFAGRIIRDARNREVFNFGKHKGLTVAEALKKDPGYCNWILENEFAEDTKKIIRRTLLNGKL